MTKKKNHRTLCHALLDFRDRPSSQPAYQYKLKGQWRTVTWGDYFNEIQCLAGHWLRLGLKPSDRVAIMSHTRREWALADTSLLSVQAITVPIYQNVTPADLQFILNDSQAKFLILEDRSLIRTYLKIREQCPSVEKVFVFEKIRDEDEDFVAWSELTKPSEESSRFHEIWCENLDKVPAEQMATLIYTSGTTGLPKGVVLSHVQILSEVTEAFPMVGVSPEDVSLSFLPYAHVMGRIELWGHVAIGYTLALPSPSRKLNKT